MLAAERRQRILVAARRDGAVRVADLVAELRYSHVTIRRDLDALAEQGLLRKVRGGAMLPATPASLSDPTSSDERRPIGRALGVVVPIAYYFRHVVDGVRDVAARHGHTVRLATSGYDAGAEPRLVRELIESGVVGLLIAPSLNRGEQRSGGLGYLDQLPVPTVLIEREPPPVTLGALSTVRTAHERGVAAALAHLRELGHTRVALISRGYSQTASFVQQGYQQAVVSLGLATDVPRIVDVGREVVQPGLAPEGPEGIVDRLGAHEVTAVLCHGDEDALVLLQYLQAKGRLIPGKLSIVSYDDEVAALGDPPLTAVAPAKRQVGAAAAQVLLDLLNPDADPNPVHIQIEPRLVIRGSTAPPGSGAPARAV
jgi:DNA-binding LacI/PurR family transcriptional regulator